MAPWGISRPCATCRSYFRVQTALRACAQNPSMRYDWLGFADISVKSLACVDRLRKSIAQCLSLLSWRFPLKVISYRLINIMISWRYALISVRSHIKGALHSLCSLVGFCIVTCLTIRCSSEGNSEVFFFSLPLFLLLITNTCSFGLGCDLRIHWDSIIWSECAVYVCNVYRAGSIFCLKYNAISMIVPVLKPPNKAKILRVTALLLTYAMDSYWVIYVYVSSMNIYM